MQHVLRLFFDSISSRDIWIHFYGKEVITEKYTKNEIFSRTSKGNYHVTTCFFNGIQDVVININVDYRTKLLISISGFYGTKTSYQTVYSYQGSCVIYRTYAIKSTQPYSQYRDGVFLKSTISKYRPYNLNIFKDSTVFDCGVSLDYGNAINYIENGNVSFSRNNITNNTCHDYASLTIFSNQTCRISQSTLIDNKAFLDCFLNYHRGPHQYYYCNIIRNNAKETFRFVEATVTFEYCSIKNNNCEQSYYADPKSSGAMINSDYDGQPSDRFEIKNPLNNYYNKLSHLSTGLCGAENEVIFDIEKVFATNRLKTVLYLKKCGQRRKR